MGDPFKDVRRLHDEISGVALTKQILIERFKMMLDAEQEAVKNLDTRAAPFVEMAETMSTRLRAASRALQEVREVLQGVK